MDVTIRVSCSNCGHYEQFIETDDPNTFRCSKCQAETEIEITCDKGYLMIDTV